METITENDDMKDFEEVIP